MMVVGGLAAYTVVWDLGDVGIGLMTIFNMIALYPLSGEALERTAGAEREKRKSWNKNGGRARQNRGIPCFFVPAKEGKFTNDVAFIWQMCYTDFICRNIH